MQANILNSKMFYLSNPPPPLSLSISLFIVLGLSASICTMLSSKLFHFQTCIEQTMRQQYTTNETLSPQWSTILCVRTGILEFGPLPRRHGKFPILSIHFVLYLILTSSQFDWTLASKLDSFSITSFHYMYPQKFDIKSQECVKKKKLPCDLTQMPKCSKIGKCLTHQVWILIVCVYILNVKSNFAHFWFKTKWK